MYYVNDTFVTILRAEIECFTSHINQVDPYIKFTYETGEGIQLRLESGSLEFTFFRKPTQINIWILVRTTLCNISTAWQEHFFIVLNILCLILMASNKNYQTSQLPCNTADIHPGLLQLPLPHLILQNRPAVKHLPPVGRILCSRTTVGFPRFSKESLKSVVFTFLSNPIAPFVDTL